TRMLIPRGGRDAAFEAARVAVGQVKKEQPKKDPPKKPGVAHVYDGGGLFSEKAIDRIKSTFGGVQFDRETSLTIETVAAIPKDKQGDYNEDNKAKFFEQWAKDMAKGDKATGVYVLVCRSPGYVVVICDKSTRDRGFAAANEQRLRDMLLAGFKEAAEAKKDGKPDEEVVKLRDKGLANAGEYVAGVLKGTPK
ncbi:MAG: hypothetical protein K2V38_15890, partial [Gemmataceae bacterium]|nr:hypothetical protein [Gemmataceae bacterium]